MVIKNVIEKFRSSSSTNCSIRNCILACVKYADKVRNFSTSKQFYSAVFCRIMCLFLSSLYLVTRVTEIYNVQGFNHDVPSLWDRRHEGATRSAECTDASEWPLSASDLTMHGTSCLTPFMTCINSLRSRNLEANFRSGRWRIVNCRKSMHGFASHMHDNAFVTS